MSIVIQDRSLRGGNPNEAFSYRDLNFQADSEVGGLHIDDTLAINNSIRNIINTKRGSRTLDPTFGSNLDQFLFEELNSSTAQEVGEHIETVLQQEPRIVVLEVIVQIDRDRGGFNVIIIFNIPSLGLTDQTTGLTLQGNQGVQMNSQSINEDRTFDIASNWDVV